MLELTKEYGRLIDIDQLNVLREEWRKHEDELTPGLQYTPPSTAFTSSALLALAATGAVTHIGILPAVIQLDGDPASDFETMLAVGYDAREDVWKPIRGLHGETFVEPKVIDEIIAGTQTYIDNDALEAFPKMAVFDAKLVQQLADRSKLIKAEYVAVGYNMKLALVSYTKADDGTVLDEIEALEYSQWCPPPPCPYSFTEPAPAPDPDPEMEPVTSEEAEG